MTKSTQAVTSVPRVQSLEARGIVKRFPGVLANDGIDLEVRAGEVLALLGENGAGKSTLMKVLYGLHRPDEGEIFVNGKPVRISSPLHAMRLGIGMVHQHFMLVPTFTVAENIALGLPSSKRFMLELGAVSRRLEQIAETYSLQVDPSAKVANLSVGEQQRVEILKVLYRGAHCLILDEPTAVLTPQEVDGLFETLRKMVAEGHSIIFISHKLGEVMALSNRVTVLNNGRVAGARLTKDTTREELACLMVGREVLQGVTRPKVEYGEPRLQLRGICARGHLGLPVLTDVNLEVRAGEILGLAGISGNGQHDLAEVISGLHKPTAGSVIMNGEDVTNWSPDKKLKNGFSYISEERMVDGTVPNFTLQENLVFRDIDRPPYAKGLFLDFKSIKRESEKLIREFNVKTPSSRVAIKSLSGGNIQKLILARELTRQPTVLVAAQPTRGLDVGASEYVYEKLIQQRSRGISTLLISEDLDEVLALSDRIAVIFDGRIVKVLEREDATLQELGLLMGGEKTASAPA